MSDPKQLNPTRYERDFLVQVWIDRRDLATIAGYMDSHGMRPKYLSDVLRFCVENMKTLAKLHGAQEIEKTSEASTFLEFRFGISMSPGGKGRKNYLGNLILDSGYVPTFKQEIPGRTEVVTPRRLNLQEVSEEDIAALKRKSQEQFKGSDHLVEDREKKDSEKLSEEQKAFEDLIKNKDNL